MRAAPGERLPAQGMRRPGSRSGSNRNADDRRKVWTRAARRLPGMGHGLVASSRTPEEKLPRVGAGAETARRQARAPHLKEPARRSGRQQREGDIANELTLGTFQTRHKAATQGTRHKGGGLTTARRVTTLHRAQNIGREVPLGHVRSSVALPALPSGQPDPSSPAYSFSTALLRGRSRLELGEPLRRRRTSAGHRPVLRRPGARSVRQWSSFAFFSVRVRDEAFWTRPRAGTTRRWADVGPGGCARQGPAIARCS